MERRVFPSAPFSPYTASHSLFVPTIQYAVNVRRPPALPERAAFPQITLPGFRI